eukprot:COSAG06_NODE_52106_length_307_cov_10.870192_1_plen_64_part_10
MARLVLPPAATLDKAGLQSLLLLLLLLCAASVTGTLPPPPPTPDCPHGPDFPCREPAVPRQSDH